MIPPNPNSKHNLTEFLSKRGESKLESYHDRFAHFANCGMRQRLADSLNLAGTARFNLAIRHKRSLIVTTENPTKNPSVDGQDTIVNTRKKIPVAWEKVVPFFNHTELAYVNGLANEVGCRIPFPKAEPLQPANGERFFSRHMETLKEIGSKRGEDGDCLCNTCIMPVTAATSIIPVAVNPAPTRQQTTHTTTAIVAEKTNTTKKTPTARVTQQRLAESVTHRHVRAPATTNRQPTHQPLAPCNPYWYQPMNVFCLPPLVPPPPCCLKYKDWLITRRVRPPHHQLCPNR